MTFTCLTLALTLLFEGAGGAAGAPALPTATATATATTGAGGAPAPAAADSNGPDGVPAEAGPPESEMDATERPQAPTPLPAVRTGHLQGRGMAKGSRDVISGASVVADLVDLGPTDEQGYFIGEVPCGPRRLAVQSPGFDEAAATVDACAPMPEPLVIRLVPASDANAYRTLVRTRPPQPAIHISEQELVKTPGSLGDPLRVIESLPGVSSVAWPAPVYAVRGSNPGNTGFFLDGVRMPALFHMALGPSVIHPYFLSGLDFYPGGYPAKYGRYAAGVVTAETRPGDANAIHSSVDARLFDAGGMVSAPVAGGTVAVAARYSYTGELVSRFSKNLVLRYWDYQLRADRRVGALQLTLLVFGSGDDFVPTSGKKASELQLGFHRVSLRAMLPLLGGRLQGSVVLGGDHSQAPIADTYPIIVNARNVAPRLSYTHTFGPADVAVGFDGEIGRYEPTYIGPLQSDDGWDLASHRTAYLLAGYASTTVHAGSRVTVTPEVRYDHYEVSGAQAHDLAPRLSARIAVRDDTGIRIAGGHFTQLPSLPLQIPGAEAFGLQLLGLQTAWQSSMGVETVAIPAVELSVTGFLQHYELTELRDPTLTSLNTVGSELLARREALSYGVEFMARRALTNQLYGWISYTLSNSQRAYGGGAVGPSDWDQRHVLNMVAGYRIGHNTLGARFHLNTGRPIVLNEGVKRLPTFYQLDLRADHVIYYNKVTVNLYAELVNATATDDVYSYSEPGNNIVQQSSYRIVLPSLGVRIEF